jgi:hypothetical protein
MNMATGAPEMHSPSERIDSQTCAKRWLVTTCIVALLVGCAAPAPLRQPYNAAAHREIVRIVVIEPEKPLQYIASPGTTRLVALVAGPFQGLGAIVGLPFLAVAEAVEFAKAGAFTETVGASNHDISLVLAEALQSELTAVGLHAVVRRVERAAQSTGDKPAWADDYGRWRDEADAVLDLQILEIGYRAYLPHTPYLPALVVGVRLVETRTLRILYRNTESFGFGRAPRGELGGDAYWRVGVLAEAGQGFATFEDLVVRREEALAILRDAARMVATRIASDFEKP